MSSFWLFGPPITGFLLVLYAHALFSSRLRKTHPRLWERFRELYWTIPNDSRTAALKTEVYSRIEDKVTLRFLNFQRLSWIAYVAGVLLSILAFIACIPPIL